MKYKDDLYIYSQIMKYKKKVHSLPESNFFKCFHYYSKQPLDNQKTDMAVSKK